MIEAGGHPADRRLDGNALAGPLSDVFVFDIVAATGTCAGCGTTGTLAEQPLYADAPAFVLRCSGCGGVLLRCLADGQQVRLDLTGLQLLSVRRPVAGHQAAGSAGDSRSTDAHHALLEHPRSTPTRDPGSQR